MARLLLTVLRMSRPQRHLRPGAVVEITSRTIHGRFLLLPTRKLTAVILGVIGRALAKYGVVLHALFFTSNHYHLIVTIPDVRTLALFMNFLNSNVAREAGRMFGWREKFWGRRYRGIEILDEAAQVERLHYVLSHGCKEGLVADPRDWPGATCVSALLEETRMSGIWVDRTAEWYARRRGETFDEDAYAERVEFELAPLPCWAELSSTERRGKVLRMVEEIVATTREHNRRKNRKPMGVAKVLQQHPHDHPDSPKKSPAPRCHTTDRDLWIRFVKEVRAFREAYRVAADRWLDGAWDTVFPPNCFPPPLTYLRRPEPALVPS